MDWSPECTAITITSGLVLLFWVGVSRFSACHTNDISQEVSFQLDFDIVLASVLVDIAILGRCQALVRDCGYVRERWCEMGDQKWHSQCIICL